MDEVNVGGVRLAKHVIQQRRRGVLFPMALFLSLAERTRPSSSPYTPCPTTICSSPCRPQTASPDSHPDPAHSWSHRHHTHRGQREVGAQLLLVDAVLGLTQALGPERKVPPLEGLGEALWGRHSVDRCDV